MSENIVEETVRPTGTAHTKKETVLHNTKQILLLFVAALATAVSLELFLLPSNMVIGGALGIASILDILLCSDGTRWFFSAGVWLIAVNIPVVIYCFLSYRKRFAVKTMLYILFLAAQMLTLRLLNVSALFESLIASSGEKDMVLYVIVGGALHGVSLPIVLSVNASTGGSDIVGLIVQRKSKRSSSSAMRIILATNVAVVLVSAVVYGVINHDSAAAINMFIYSVAAMFICEIVQEWIFQGFSAAMELEITTDKPQEMIDALQTQLKRGTTKVKVVGGYTQQEKTMVLCVVNKRQLVHARRIIHNVDENAFAYVENVKEVMGRGFANKEIDLDNEEDE